MLKKGLVEIERLNSRNINYILTPEGIKEKTQKTIDYIKRSYQAIQQLQNRVTEFALKHDAEGKRIFIYKEEDEIFYLVTNTLNELDIEYKIINNKKKLEEIINDEIILYHWSLELELNGIATCNIFKD